MRVRTALLCIFLPALLWAQTDTKNFIRAATRGGANLITWRYHGEEPLAHFVIYRHTKAIHSRARLRSATLIAEVHGDTAQYIDIAPEAGEYYYAVLPVLADGRTINTLRKRENTLEVPLVVHEIANFVATAAQILDIEAENKDGSILVHFETSNRDRHLVVLRSETPIRSGSELFSIAPLMILEAGETSFEDIPPKRIPYFYSIHDASLFQERVTVVMPYENTLAQGITLNESAALLAEKGPLREQEEAPDPAQDQLEGIAIEQEEPLRQDASLQLPPSSSSVEPAPAVVVAPVVTSDLPTLSPAETGFDPNTKIAPGTKIETILPLAEVIASSVNPRLSSSYPSALPTLYAQKLTFSMTPQPLSEDAEPRVAQLLKKRETHDSINPYILPSSAYEAPEDHNIETIAETFFAREDYREAKARFESFLNTTPHDLSAYTEDLLRFYLGQCEYFLENYFAALYHFMSITPRSSIYVATEQFIDVLLRAHSEDIRLQMERR